MTNSVCIEAVGASHLGNVRTNNEDCWEAVMSESHNDLPHDLDGLIVVADGMGGHEAGEEASSRAVATFIESCRAGSSAPSAVACMRAAIHDANHAVRSLAADYAEKAPGATLSALALSRHGYVVAHVGDSRIYLLRDESAHQLTRDHTWLQDQVRSGTISEADAAGSRFRNVLSRAVGITDELEADCSSGEWLPGDIFLLCTDGLTEHVMQEELHGIVRSADSLNDAVQALLLTALERGGSDNVTVVLAAPLGEPAPADFGHDLRKAVTLPSFTLAD